MTKTLKFGAFALVAVSTAFAQQGRVYNEGGQWMQEITGTIGGAKALHVQVSSATVKVEGSNDPNITYTLRERAGGESEDSARRIFKNYEVETGTHGDTASIEGHWHGGQPHHFSAELTIHVPQQMEAVNVDTDGGSISVGQLSGKVEAQTGGGEIRLNDIGGPVRAETGGGAIDIQRAGGDVSVETGGGNIRVGALKGRLKATSGGGSIQIGPGATEATLETGGGDVRLERCSGLVKASTGGGGLDIGEVDGRVQLETGGGSIRVGPVKGKVNAETGSGEIEVNGAYAVKAETGSGSITAKMLDSSEKEDSSIETNSGNVTVYLTQSANLTVRAAVESGGQIHSDFSQVQVKNKGEDYGGEQSAEGTINAGGPTLKITTTHGDIRLRHQ